MNPILTDPVLLFLFTIHMDELSMPASFLLGSDQRPSNTELKAYY